MKHRIVIEYQEKSLANFFRTLRIHRYINTALREQGVHFGCEINVLVTNDEEIRVLNREDRGIDRSTDVLSFPMFQFEPGVLPETPEEYQDPDTGLVPLGDMAISMEHVEAQAKEYGHSVNREFGYLTVHSVLHLLGYDHMDDGPMKKQMREREEAILAVLGLKRD